MIVDLAILVVVFWSGSTTTDTMSTADCRRLEDAIRSGLNVSVQTIERGWLSAAAVKCVPVQEFVKPELTQ